jgi:hypothetical protein
MTLFLRMLIISSLLTGCVDFAVNTSKYQQPKSSSSRATYPPAEISTMRGGLGGVFSKGMNHLENTLENNYGITASSTVWYKGPALSKAIIRDHQAHPSRPIILVGHSLGANEQINVAKTLNRAHIPVALLITIDPVMPTTVSPNVQHAINLYKSSFMPMFSGLKISAQNPQLTHLENINVATLPGANVNHFTIDNNPVIQHQMLEAVLQTLKTSPTAKGAHVKIG